MERVPAVCFVSRCLIWLSTANSRRAVIVSSSMLMPLIGALLLGGCDKPRASDGVAHHVPVHREQNVLRVRVDAAHFRTWVLSLDDVAVYETSTQKLIRRIKLPPWSVAAVVCPPDMALDIQGTAFISHNLEPRIWEIRVDGFELTEHTLRLSGKEHLDIGFGRLVIAKDGTLEGRASTGGSAWKIDLHEGAAREIEPRARSSSSTNDDCHSYGAF